MFGVVGFGPLDENEATYGPNKSLTSRLLNIVAVALLVIGEVLNEKG